MKFYRVCNAEQQEGLWYKFDGTFSGYIHDKFDFCKASALKMDYDEELVGWLSAAYSLENLYQWFTKDEIKQLENSGYFVYEYEAENYKFYERFQHFVINQETSKILRKITYEEISKEIEVV